MAELEKFIVAAIDFGTTYSGYAYSLTREYATNKHNLKIFCNQKWNSGARGLISLKTPTTILVDNKRRFHSFGYEAEDNYSQLAEEGHYSDWYYFSRFKMELYKNEKLNRDTEIYDTGRKAMPAITIFTMSIKYLKDHLMTSLEKQGLNVDEEEIAWVLTVPAIWDDSAKQFMREAAQEAGIDSASLKIALEPEAASLFCQHIPVEKLHGGVGGIQPFSPGKRYLVLDAGGGTVDITIHRVKEDGDLIELYKASGGDWGGTRIDEEYRNMLTSFTEQDTMDDFCHMNTAEYLDLLREFETKKRSISRDNVDKRVSIKVPIALKDSYDVHHPETDINCAIKNCPFGTKIQWKRDKLQMGPNVFAGLFRPTCDNIIKHVKKLLEKPTLIGTNTIIMVGGFSESFVLQSKIREAFANMTVIIPEDAGLAVLKGAVLFGLNPNIIASRVAKYTYGFDVVTNFDPKIHDPNKMELYDGVEKCKDIFSKHIEKNQDLPIGEAQVEKTYTPSTHNQTEMRLALYISSEKDPMYVTDQKCRYIGSMIVKIPDITGGTQREVKTRILFGRPEITVEAREVETGNITSAKFNFLEEPSLSLKK